MLKNIEVLKICYEQNKLRIVLFLWRIYFFNFVLYCVIKMIIFMYQMLVLILFMFLMKKLICRLLCWQKLMVIFIVLMLIYMKIFGLVICWGKFGFLKWNCVIFWMRVSGVLGVLGFLLVYQMVFIWDLFCQKIQVEWGCIDYLMVLGIFLDC